MNKFKRLMQIIALKKSLLFAASFLASINALLNLVPYILVYLIIKQIVEDDFSKLLLQEYVIYGVLAIVISYFCLYVSLILSHVAAFEIIYKFRLELIEKITKFSLGSLQGFSTGVLKKNLIDDIEKLEVFVAHNFPDLIKSILMPFIILSFMFYLDYRLALASLFPLLLFIFWLILMIKTDKMKNLIKEYYDSAEEMDSVIIEYVRSINVMKVFNQEAKSFEKYNGVINSYTNKVINYINKNTPFYAVLISFISNALFPILSIGIYLYFENEVTLALLLLFLLLGVSYLKPVLSLSTLANSLLSIIESINRVDTLINKEEQKRVLKIKSTSSYDIEFKNVSFSYEKKQVLKNINFIIPQNTITAFVGLSGSGKSTSCELLARFYDIKKGEIKIGEVNIKDFSSKELMSKISFVFQDNFMFNKTLFENITMGKEYSKEEVIEACKKVNLHEYISKLPLAYETLYGKDGISLSGGEKQKVQLARIVLKDSPIFIFDEATAFFDAKNEFEIQNSLKNIIKDKTVIVIAHRLSTIVDVNQIFVFKDGEVVSKGRHEDLLNTCDEYKELWSNYECD